jgi:hypothetical protein
MRFGDYRQVRAVPAHGLTLHEAMAEVLRSEGGGWMDRDEIAREIARRDLFRRPSDGSHPPSDQLRLRARKPEYQHLFECSDNRCSKIRLRHGARASAGRERAESSATEPKPKAAAPASPAVGSATGTGWYEELRERYRPARLCYLLIAESPPDPGEGERRFFYSPELTIDNLYRGVAEAVYGERDDVDVRDKSAVLERLREDGFWLIDAVEDPVNKLGRSDRVRAIKDGVPQLIARCIALGPERGAIICHGKVYAATAQALRDGGVPVLHDEALPFPLGNWRARFVEGFRRALQD